jgi:hypothetical protein|tara:strand:+ start:620 stop:880 length:261 start_codon:yes stop_codon:yes gene_type:complete
MSEMTVEDLVAELMALKIEDKQVFTGNVIRVDNKIILTGMTATVPVVVQTLEVDEDGELVRARNEKGQYQADNPDTVENEAFKEEE